MKDSFAWDVVDKLIKGNEEHLDSRAKEHAKEEKARATRRTKTNEAMNSLFRGGGHGKTNNQKT